LRKTVSGGDTAKGFTFVVSFSDIVMYEGAPYTGGTVMLKHNQTARFDNIPIGTAYTIREENYTIDGYSTSPADRIASGEITVASPINVSFINTYHTSGGGGDGDSGNDPPPQPPAQPPAQPRIIPPEDSGGGDGGESGDAGDVGGGDSIGRVAPGEPESYRSGGSDIDVPPNPSIPGRAIVPDGAGYLEIGDDGTPLGRWEWDPVEEEWIFDEFPPPLGNLPPTGEMTRVRQSSALLAFLLLGLSFALGKHMKKQRAKG
jgi:hypothetical protein